MISCDMTLCREIGITDINVREIGITDINVREIGITDINVIVIYIILCNLLNLLKNIHLFSDVMVANWANIIFKHPACISSRLGRLGDP